MGNRPAATLYDLGSASSKSGFRSTSLHARRLDDSGPLTAGCSLADRNTGLAAIGFVEGLGAASCHRCRLHDL